MVKNKNKCSEPYCKNKRTGRSRVCCKHKNIKQRLSNPVNASYQILKDNAKRRKKVFELTLSHFTEVVVKSGYMEGKGRLSDSLTIDRIKNELGYIDGNIQVMPKCDNIIKYFKYDSKVNDFVLEEIEDLPF